MQDKKEYDKYEAEVVDDDLSGNDVNANPTYYIHLAIIACQKALDKEDIKERIYAYRMAVDHLEALCDAADLLEAEYFLMVSDFKKSKEYQEEEHNYNKVFKLARLQFKLLNNRFFSNKVMTDPLKA